MSSVPGTRFGPYQIVEAIGAGGMGQVFRAHDSRLGRDVALKMLPEEFARDAGRLARFEREARLLAALSHPHIGAIYGVEDAGGTPALVLELVEGRTLAERIQERGRGRWLAIEETIAIARQIVDALSAAHEKGIVHRDLKPANVKITPAGAVKLLDFGIGRAAETEHDLPPPPASGDPTALPPTLVPDSTLPGSVLGTPAYMSPEQARGLPVDRRTDIWAFGCVLFEMVTGTVAFGGATAVDTLTQIVAREPDWGRLPERTPPAIRRLLKRCLQKDPIQRLSDVRDARFDLDEALGEHDELLTAEPATRAAPEVRLARITDSLGTVGSPAISPDGKMVAFVAVGGGRRQIWLRMLAGGAPLQVTRGNADHDQPRWMQDSSALVYYALEPGKDEGHLWQVAALGGPPRRLAASLGGGDISHDGRRLAFFRRTGEGIALVVAALDGTATETVLDIPPGFWCDQPRWSPDDRLIAFQRVGEAFNSHLDVVSVAERQGRTVIRAGWIHGLSWLPDGSGIVYSSSTGSTLAYPPTHNLRVVGEDGSGDRQLTFGDVSYFEPDVHTSGRLLARRLRSRSDVWRFPVEREPADNVRNATRITYQTGQIQVPSVSPDGREMVYVSDNGGHSNLWLAATDGTSVRQITFESDPGVTVAVPMWSPAGQEILFVRAHGAHVDVCLINSDGTGLTTPLTDAFAPCWSGDGQSIYCSRVSGRIERLDRATGAVVPVRSDRATAPAAARHGGVLFFVRPAQFMVGVVGDDEVCRAEPEDGPAEVLARIPTSKIPLAPTLHLHVSVSPDGRWLAGPLLDSSSANIWLIPTEGGPMRAVTDFGERSVFIARWISWSPDSHHVYAAVADTDADIVVLDGVLG